MNAEGSPAKTVTLSFAALIAFGTLLLRLPIAAVGDPLTAVDALFMATSAACVTGLGVIDTATRLSTFGQTVILALVQIGGLGIMTFSVFFFLAFGMRTPLTSRLAVSDLSRGAGMQDLAKTLGWIFLMTLTFEAIGAILLFTRFIHRMPAMEAVSMSIFHSVSAYCNAGFSLFSDSLMWLADDPATLFIIMGLVVMGGLGFVVVDEIRAWIMARIEKRRMTLSLHTRICLTGTFALLVVGTVVLWALERQNVLSGMPAALQWTHALFLSAASRTAGFNTVETSYLTNSSLFIVVILMFIGGCPGSTAGGIKVTTFVILWRLIRAQIRGHGMVSAFHRTVPGPVVGKALAVFASAFILVNIATLLLQTTEGIGVSHQAVENTFLELLFETTSAFATTGLSTGITPSLSDAGKVLLSFLMLAGRVGPLTIGLAVLIRRRRGLRYQYAEEDVLVG